MSDQNPNRILVLLTCLFVSVSSLLTLLQWSAYSRFLKNVPPPPQRIPTRDNYATERTVEL